MKIPHSLVGQDTRLSPVRPGFNSRLGNFLDVIEAKEVLPKEVLPGLEPGS